MGNFEFCFVILNYQGYEDTVACVNSIRRLDDFEKSKVIIIDNASPDGSGERLKVEYLVDANIDVLLNGCNDGFSRANNKACRYAKRKYDPKFYIVMNNDVVIDDIYFLNKIEVEYRISGFDVLGPDIYNPIQNVHQSPLGENIPGILPLTKTVIMNKLLLFTAAAFSKPAVAYFRYIYGNAKDAYRYEVRQMGVCLMGACLIASREFMDSKKRIFYPETDFYYEEYILSLYCRSKHKTVVYNPGLVVLHNSGSSTKRTYAKELERYVFVIKSTIKAATVCREYQKWLNRRCRKRK